LIVAKLSLGAMALNDIGSEADHASVAAQEGIGGLERGTGAATAAGYWGFSIEEREEGSIVRPACAVGYGTGPHLRTSAAQRRDGTLCWSTINRPHDTQRGRRHARCSRPSRTRRRRLASVHSKTPSPQTRLTQAREWGLRVGRLPWMDEGQPGNRCRPRTPLEAVKTCGMVPVGSGHPDWRMNSPQNSSCLGSRGGFEEIP